MSDQNIVNSLETLQLEKERLRNKIEISKKMIASNLKFENVKNSAAEFLPSAFGNFIVPKVSGLLFGEKNRWLNMFFTNVFPIVFNSVMQMLNRNRMQK